MAEPVYVSLNIPNVITIGLIVLVIWTALAAGISLTRQYVGSSGQTAAAA